MTAGPLTGGDEPPAHPGVMTNCRTGRKEYDEADVEAVKYHMEPVDCGQSCRCRGKPRCKTCFGSFCFCSAH